MDPWELLGLHVSDPQLAELIEAAQAPLVPEVEDERVILPVGLLGEISEHAEGAEPGHEIVGALVTRQGVANRYVPLTNIDDRPGSFRVKPWHRSRPGETAYLLHSHPSSGATPSPADLSGTARSVIGIYASGGVYLWKIADDRRSFRGVPVEVVDDAAAATTTSDPAVEAQLAAMVESDERLRREAAKARPVTASGDRPTTLLGEVSFVQPTSSGYTEVADIVFVRRPQA